MYSENELNDLLFDDYEKENYEVVLSKLNSILQEEPDNKYALKFKIDVLSCSGKYNDAMELCNHCLKYSQDIEFLTAKAEILLGLNKYNECIKLCNQLLLADPKNKHIRRILKLADQTDLGIFNLLKIRAVQIIVVLLSFFWIVYFHPTRETMVCNEQFNCEIEHEFFNKFVFTRYLKLNLYSNIELNKSMDLSKHDHARIKYDGKDPFIFYVLSSTLILDSELNEFYQNEFNKLLAYKKNPKNGYKIHSCANSFVFYLWLIIYIVILLCCISPKSLNIKKNL